jgi:hypothetical protein
MLVIIVCLFRSFTVGYLNVCPSLNYNLWLPIRYLQTFLQPEDSHFQVRNDACRVSYQIKLKVSIEMITSSMFLNDKLFFATFSHCSPIFSHWEAKKVRDVRCMNLKSNLSTTYVQSCSKTKIQQSNRFWVRTRLYDFQADYIFLRQCNV